MSMSISGTSGLTFPDNTTMSTAATGGGGGEVSAWVNFNGDTGVVIRGSFNVSSITDNSTGNFTVNFSTPMSNSNYAVSFNAMNNNGISGVRFHGAGLRTTTSVDVFMTNDSRGGDDPEYADLVVYT